MVQFRDLETVGIKYRRDINSLPLQCTAERTFRFETKRVQKKYRNQKFRFEQAWLTGGHEA